MVAQAEACAACGPAIIGAIVFVYIVGMLVGYVLGKAFARKPFP